MKRKIGKLEELGIDKRQKNCQVLPRHVFIPSTQTNLVKVTTWGHENATGIHVALSITWRIPSQWLQLQLMAMCSML